MTNNATMRAERAAWNDAPFPQRRPEGADVMARAYTNTCKVCGNPFQATDRRLLTCSPECFRICIADGAAKRKGDKSGTFTHGATVDYQETPEHVSWRGMKERCLNPNHQSAKYYTPLGVSIAPEWLGKNGFSNFLAHIGPKPTPQHQIDRYPDRDGNYEPGNVRWATPYEQTHNQRPRKPFTHCRRGHPRTPENRVPNGTPTGACGPCRVITNAAAALRAKESE